MEAEQTDGDVELWASGRGSYSRDFLQRFSSAGCHEAQPEASRGDLDDVELSLGLSLGGCFGVDPPKESKLFRSTSIASMSMFADERELAVAAAPLARTCSLPAECEEEHRKRKEMQSLKRLEAKRKRLEKRNSRAAALAAAVIKDQQEESSGQGLKPAASMKVEKLEVELDGCRGFGGSGQFGGLMDGVTPSKLPEWAAALDRRVSAADGAKSYASMSQGSIGSQGSGSSGLDFEGRLTMQGYCISGVHSSTESNSPVSANQKAAAAPPASMASSQANCVKDCKQDPTKKRRGRPNGMDEIETSMMRVMPCVSTTGDGPNGRKIEGFLYKYHKGEEVRIVCVCHGSFLTPAEFVKHAGGGDVPHPLRHIVVSPSPSAFS